MCDKPAAYWRSKYEALEARIQDPMAVQNATAIVDSAARIAAEYNQPFRQVYEAMCKTLTRSLRPGPSTPRRKQRP